MTDSAMERVRNRAKDLREFYGHLTTYVLVCGLLVVIDLLDSSTAEEFLGLNWAYWPIIGWGIAVTIHAVSVFLPLAGREERKAEQLYEKERQRQLLHH